MPRWEYEQQLPQLFRQPKGITMQEPLSVSISVSVKDASGAVVYSAEHCWAGMSEKSEVEFLAALHNAVTDLGRAKAAGKSKPA
jgi:hypothetical protein